MTDKKKIAGLALIGAVGLTGQADAAEIPRSNQDSVVVGGTAEATLEEIILASGLHQQYVVSVDELLLGKGYKRDLIKKPSHATIEEVVLASGLHQQATAMTSVSPAIFEETTTKHGLQPEKIDYSITNPTAAQLEEILLASGLHQQAATVALYDVEIKTLEEIVLASGLHQQAKVFVYDDVTTPAIEEIILASGLHQQYAQGAPRTIVLDDPDTEGLDYTVMSNKDI